MRERVISESTASPARHATAGAWGLLALLVVAIPSCAPQEPVSTVGGDSDAGLPDTDADADADGRDASEVVDAEAGGVSFSTGFCGPAGSVDAACVACADERCCEQEAKCEGSPACVPMLACEAGCGSDAACREQCENAHVDGMPEARALNACKRRECGEACGSLPEEACGVDVTADEACDACERAHCCEETYEAARNPDYWRWMREMADCGFDKACQTASSAEHQEGATLGYLAMNCSFISCPTDCAAKGSWPCGLMRPTGATASCVSCLESDCCEETQAMVLSGDLWRYFFCEAACNGGSGCDLVCATTYPEGYGLMASQNSCLTAACASPCNMTSKPCGAIGAEGTQACRDCTGASCCEEARQASQSPETYAYDQCVSGYSSFAENQCVQNFPTGAANRLVFDACTRRSCAAECENGSATCGLTHPGEPCPACEIATCCDASEQCALDFDCTRIELCRTLQHCLPSDAACLDSCKAANPEGVARFDELTACRTGPCAQPCEAY